MTLTLVPDSLAKRGAGFTFSGPNAGEECKGCPFQRLCFGLVPGHHYQVARVRDVHHPCNLHDGARVRVVEVEETTFATSLEIRHLRGTAAQWAPIPCGMPECANYALCHPVGPRPGKVQIVADEGHMDCPAGFEIAKVRVKPLE